MNEKNLAAVRAAALALVRQAELAGVVVTIATVPGVPLAMRNYRMEVDVRAGRGGAPVAADLSEQDAGLLEQGASMLEALAGDERNRGNDSAAMGAECSAHAVRRLFVALRAPHNLDALEEARRTVAQIAIVGHYNEQDVILRASVLEMLDRRIIAARTATEPGGAA